MKTDKDTQLLSEAYEQMIKEDVVTATAGGPVSQDTNLTRGPNTNIPTYPPKFKTKKRKNRYFGPGKPSWPTVEYRTKRKPSREVQMYGRLKPVKR